MSEDKSHAAIQELLGVYALDAIDPVERGTVDRHLQRCSECRSEVAQHRNVAAKLATNERSAPTDLWPPIADKIATRGRAPETAAPSKRRSLRPVAVAASIAVLGAVALVQSVRLDDANAQLDSEREALAALEEQTARPGLDQVVSAAMGRPGTQLVSLGSDSSAANAIIVLMPDGTGYLSQHTLQPLPADRTYQLWAIVNGRVISAGVLGPDPDVVPFRIDAHGFEGFAITEEAIGGVVASENAPVVAWLEA